jgi:hypothetical protein
MVIKTPHPNPNALATAPKARVPAARKPAYSRRFQALGGGPHCPPHCPPQPGAKLREHGPFLPAPATEIGPFPPLGIPLNIAEVARMIGCSPWSIRQTLIPRGLPHFRFTANGRLIFYRDQVVRWIENQQQGGH